MLRRFLTRIRNAEVDPRSMENDRTPPYTSNDTTAPSHNLPGRDSDWQPEYPIGVAGASQVATPNYIYYRIYAEDGAIPSKRPAAAGDPFLGRIKTISVPPPRTLKVVEDSILEVEDIQCSTTTIFLTPYSQSPISNKEKATLLPISTPQKPLALVAKMTYYERSALESKRRGGLSSAAEADTTSPETQYLYYMLYGIKYEMPSKVAFDSEVPSLGRIRVDSVAPPRSLTSIKRCILRVEGNPALAYANLFADTSSKIPLKEGPTILRSDGPGLNPNEPMAIVQVKNPSIPDGRYHIKNRAKNIYWIAGVALNNPIQTVYFYLGTKENAKTYKNTQWDITQDGDGNISITSLYVQPGRVGADMTWSTVPVPWRLIPADGKSYYLTTDMNPFSQNPRVPAVQLEDMPQAQGKSRTFTLSTILGKSRASGYGLPGTMASLKEGDQWQMWEFIPV